ncbi:MAG: phospholipase D-like domain-containing protein [Candidatus Rhabdochlamydia sp.]
MACVPAVRKSKLSLIALFFAVFYVILIKTALSPEIPSSQNPCILYSNHLHNDFRLTLKNSFLAATDCIDLWMYAITDPLLIKTLHKKAHEGVTLTIHLDPKASMSPSLALLQPTRMKSKGLMHRKIALIDDKTLFLGSANMTPSSLQLHDNLSVGLYHEGAVSFLKAPHQKNYTFTLPSSSSLEPPMQGTLWLLPDPLALKKIEAYIQEASESITVAMFTLTQKNLIQAIIDAHLRGVEVKVALDRYTAQGASKQGVKALIAHGVPIYLSLGRPLLHHKWAYIDHHTLILGSTNWTQSAFEKNDDILLFLEGLTPALQKQMNQITQALEDESKTLF